MDPELFILSKQCFQLSSILDTLGLQCLQASHEALPLPLFNVLQASELVSA